MQWRRRILLLAVAAAVLAAVGYGFMPRPVAVETVPVTAGPLSVSIEEEGKTRVLDRFVISAPVAGYARRIGLKVGDPVRRGQPLVELEPLRSAVLDPRSRAEAEARVAGARAALHGATETVRAAAARAALATAELARFKKLFQEGYTTRGNLDKAEAEAASAAAQRRSARFAVEVARYELDAAATALRYSAADSTGRDRWIALRAPMDGRVLKIEHESEGPVGQGASLIEIGDPRALEVAVDVLSADAVRIRPGMRVLLERWGGGIPLEARVRVVEPAGFTKVSALGVEEQRVWVIADLESPARAWQRLGDGYRVEARFLLWEGKDVLQVPASALFRYRDGWAVFVAQDGRARRRPVRIGHRNGLSAQVMSGLKGGESVIIHPDEAIGDGSRVHPRNENPGR